MRNPIVGNIRPALLLMLLSAAGLGVPGAFAQTTAKSPAKKKAAHGSTTTSSKNTSGKSSLKSSGKTAATHKGTEAAPPHAVASHAAAGHSSGTRNASRKTSSSKRSRRQPGQKSPTADRVSEIQSALSKDGSFSGEPSGKWDDATSDAMRRFQASHGLNPTGKLDALTLQKLGLGSQIAGVAAPTPPPGAVSRLTSSNSLSTTESARRQ